MSIKIISLFTISALCINAFCVDVDKLVNLQGNEYAKARDEILESLKVDDDGFKAQTDETWQTDLLKKILHAKIKYPELFDKLSLVVEKSRKDPVYSQLDTDFGNSDTGHLIISGNVSRFMRQGIGKKEYVTIENKTGLLGDSFEVKHTQTDEAVAKANELNSAARLAVIEKLWKLTTDYRITYELVGAINGGDSDNKNKDIVPLVKEIFSTSEYDRTIKTCSLFLERYMHKDFLPELRKALKKFYGKKNYKCCYAIISSMESIIHNDNEDLQMIDEMLPELEEMKEAEIAKNEKDWEEKNKKSEEDKKVQMNGDKTKKKEKNENMGLLIH